MSLGIRRLNEQTINKIAAGEVVERPASVVKELVENSLDAASKSILVEIVDSPDRYLRVLDDGKGINPEDVELLFERYATSKISEIKDLDKLGTLGFRGEALSSIASVSRIELVASTGEGSGVKVLVEAGNFEKKEKIGAPQGTNIIVQDLFFNTPARKKFLKTKATETKRIQDIVTKYALANPEVHFRMRAYGNEVLNSPGTADDEENIAYIWGKDEAREMLYIYGKDEGVEIRGLISQPTLNRGTPADMAVFVNGRAVRSSKLNQAVIDGCRTQLMKHRYPVCVVFISVDPSKMDVNIHPAKIEVKFQEEKKILRTLEGAVNDAYAIIDAAPRTNSQGFFEVDPVIPEPEPILDGEEELSRQLEERDRLASISNTRSSVSEDLDVSSSQLRFPEEDESNENKTLPQLPGLKNLRLIGQVHDTYLICQSSEGIVVIDQHAAAERINLEKILRSAEVSKKQEMITPLSIGLEQNKVDILMENSDVLAEIGLEVEEFGKGEILIRSIPLVFEKNPPVELIKQMLEEIVELGSARKIEDYRMEAAHMMACKASLKANDPLSKGQMEKLIKELTGTERTYSCAHGRPTVLTLSLYELEKKFKRIV